MAKTSGEIEKEFIEGLSSSTGANLDKWIVEISKTGIEKRNDVIKWLKEEKKFGHMNASLLTGIYFNNGKPVYGNENELLDNQFTKCPEMRKVFTVVTEFILTNFPETKIIPKKTYISFTAKKEFAAINVKPDEIRLGFDLGDTPFNADLEKSKLTGPMPRISHMVVISNEKQIGNKLKDYLAKSYYRTN
ncbi:MAG: hypothetical protein JNL24_02035 [Bacteroidia bacterium]|nr:hypothetical protein [Bacteroidia bacterium]